MERKAGPQYPAPTSAVCGVLPSGQCFVDCTHEIYRLVCERVDGNQLHSDLEIFAGLKAPFGLRIWNSLNLERIGANTFVEVNKLILTLELQNVPNLTMFPEIDSLTELKNLTIQNAPGLKYFAAELLPLSVERITLFQTGISQFLGGVDVQLPALKYIKISNQVIRYLHQFFFSFPLIETIEILNCKLELISIGAQPFNTVKPIKFLHASNNTFESSNPEHQLALFRNIIESTRADSDTIIKLDHNDFPIGKRAIKIFRSISAVKSLSLRGSLFEDYNSLDNIFANFSNLKTLDLGYTGVPFLKGGTFAGLPNLEMLWLDGNKFRDLDTVDLFKGLQARNLSFLDLSHNELTDQPKGFESFGKNLLTYNLENNRLSSRVFLNRIQYFPSLRFLLEGRNGKTSFRSATFNPSKSLEKVDISCNPIQPLQDMLWSGMPKSLKVLNITFCLSTERDRPLVQKGAFDKFPPIEELHMGGGYFKAGILLKLQDMPPASAKSLKALHLPDNKIAYLHGRGKYFKAFSELEYLNLRNNQLQSTGTGAFSTLGKLRRLNLANNALFAIGPDDFDGLTDLKDLDLSGNGIKLIEPGAFDAIPNLQGLFLAKNYISDILAIFRFGGKQLTHLDISGLPLRCVDPKTFVKYRSIKWLYLNDSLPLFLDIDVTMNINQQMVKTPPHTWAQLKFCQGTKTVDMMTFYESENTFLKLAVDDTDNAVYQDMYAFIATCYEPNYRGIKEKISNVLCRDQNS